jgi:uncharacterized protein YqeY
MLLDQLQSDLSAAMKGRDQLRVDTLRFLLGAIFNFQIEKGKDYIATDNDILNVISKQVKTHTESIEMFTKAGRSDLVDRETAELEILKKYLPAQMSESDIKDRISDIRQKNPELDFGGLMKLVMNELRGKADGAVVARIVKEING